MPAAPPDLLRAAGLRRTPARVAVLGRIAAVGRPVSHAELQSEPDLGALDTITLYRTLTTLVEAGLVHRVHGIDGVWRYARQPGEDGCPGNHPHFLCTACGGMSCLLGQRMPRVSVPAGAQVSGRHFVAYGLCAACAASAAPPSAASEAG